MAFALYGKCAGNLGNLTKEITLVNDKYSGLNIVTPMHKHLHVCKHTVIHVHAVCHTHMHAY